MRIVAGRLRGRALSSPLGDAVRPTGDRARQAVFNIVEHGPWAADGSPLAGARVADLFAGTGAFGLEALSRGAAEAVFVEKSPQTLPVLRKNIAALGLEAQATVLRTDATQLETARRPFELVFLDPPYRKALCPPALAALARHGWLATNSRLVVEVAADETLAPLAGFTFDDERRYGAARVYFLTYQG